VGRKAIRNGIAYWPASERPRERLLANGPSALTDAELIAVVAWIASLPTQASYRPADRAPDELPMRCGGVE